VKEEKTPAAAETPDRIAAQASNLLDIAKQRAEQRAEQQKVVAIKKGTAKLPKDPSIDDDEGLGKRADTRPKLPKDIVKSILTLPPMPKKKRRLPWAPLSFVAIAVLPTVLTGLYYAFIASPQYVVETQFAVRGSTESSLSALGLTGLVGSSGQSGDSYIVTDYIHSAQILPDIKDQTGVDIRNIYSRPAIDFLYRQSSDHSLDEFRNYWRDMVNVSFNSTTGNVTLQVFAFSPTDAKQVAESVLTVSEHLVNTLSEKSRRQFVEVANQQVARSEERLRNIRNQITDLRSSEQAIDPTAVATMEASIVSSLEQELANLRSRYKALVDSISADAPSARVIERQIGALEAQVAEQKQRISGDTPESEPGDKTTRGGGTAGTSALSEMIDRFTELGVEQEFAVKAYTTSLAALEAAMQESRKQERYFAVYVPPRLPEVALYPLGLLNTAVAFAAFLCLWLIGYFSFRSVKDHAI
jgi:capsular polysaccharide transport system permease protein